MKILSLTSVFMALALAACGAPGPREPEWRGAASSALNSYVQLRLEGRDAAAARTYANALERMRDGGDLDGLHTVMLARCAMDVALFIGSNCGEFSARADGARTAALAYYDWLINRLPPTRIAQLPERYRGFAAAIGSSQSASVTAALRAVTDPVSRMVATGVAKQAQLLEETALADSAQVARTQGWRAAHRTYEEARVNLLEAAAMHTEAAALRQRLKALFAGEAAGAQR